MVAGDFYADCSVVVLHSQELVVDAADRKGESSCSSSVQLNNKLSIPVARINSMYLV